jgi:uncharacterized membrane protein
MSVPSPNNAFVKPQGVFHNLFDIVIVLKGVNGLAEIAAGSTLLLIKAGTILEWVDWVTLSELLEDPHDVLATSLEHWAMNFAYSAQTFAGLYLLAHGVIKSTFAILLFKERPWVFPLSLALFTALVAIALDHLSRHWSLALAGFILFDVFTIDIIAKEWSAAVKVSRLKN